MKCTQGNIPAKTHFYVEPMKYIETNKLTITTGLIISVKASSNIKWKETKGNVI